MGVHDFKSERLFVAGALSAGARIVCSAEQAHYLVNVLRLKGGDEVLVFNGRDGEWRVRLADVGKRACVLECEALVREQVAGPDIHYLFAPLKRARLDYMVQKATEMGVARLVPVLTRHTVAERVNIERMRANAIEAAEQCGILRVPEVAEPAKLGAVLEAWDARRPLIFCDESAEIANPVDALKHARSKGPTDAFAVLVGPEGGFAEEERTAILAKPFTVAISLGPRIMRADTAAVAALALVNAVLGDWH
jgi:16S rRNA (uracil1498-N3)-methyltransferase